MLRSVGAVGTFVLGLHEKRKKVPQPRPGLQHDTRPRPRQLFFSLSGGGAGGRTQPLSRGLTKFTTNSGRAMPSANRRILDPTDRR